MVFHCIDLPEKKLKLDPEMENFDTVWRLVSSGSDGEKGLFLSSGVCLSVNDWPPGDVLSMSHSLLRSLMCFV